MTDLTDMTDIVDLSDSELFRLYGQRKELSESSKKSYWGSIRKMTENLSDSEREEFITAEGHLKKSLSGEIIDRVLKESQFTVGTVGKRKIASCFKTNCSALSFWHKESNNLQPEGSTPIRMEDEAKGRVHDLNMEVKRFKESVPKPKDTVVEKPITFSDYKFLASLALADSSHSVLSHTLIVLCWNLMVKSCVVCDLNWNNFAVDGDHITVSYQRGCSGGRRPAPICLYANPLDPTVCPILALGIKICSETFSSKSQLNVFQSGSSSETFSRWLQRRLNDMTQPELVKLTVLPADISTNSFKTGGASYVTNFTEGPGWDHVKMRMNNDTYGYVRDQYAGRAVTGLDHDSYEFTALCPHFKDDSVDISEAISSGFMEAVTESAKAAMKIMLAAVIYHWGWLLENLPIGHPFFTSLIYTKNLNLKWKDCVTAGYLESSETGMKCSGVPMQSKIRYNLKQLTESHNNRLQQAQMAIESAEHTIPLSVARSLEHSIPVSEIDSYIRMAIKPEMDKIYAKLDELVAQTDLLVQIRLKNFFY